MRVFVRASSGIVTVVNAASPIPTTLAEGASASRSERADANAM